MRNLTQWWSRAQLGLPSLAGRFGRLGEAWWIQSWFCSHAQGLHIHTDANEPQVLVKATPVKLEFFTNADGRAYIDPLAQQVLAILEEVQKLMPIFPGS